MANKIKIGELLVQAKILEPGDVAAALELASAHDVPVGRILVASGKIDESVFQAAIRIQSMIRDGLVAQETAAQSLTLISQRALSVEMALAQVGCAVNTDKETNRLGELLMEAQITTQAKLDEAMQVAHDTGLPLGKALVALGLVWEELLQYALNSQALIRSGEVERSQAIKAIKAAHERRMPVNYGLSEIRVVRNSRNTKKVLLGTLIMEAGFVTEEQLNKALLSSVQNEDLVGHVLVEQGALSEERLERLLVVQNMITLGTLDIKAALKVLKGDRLLEEELSELEIEDSENKIKIKFLDFLRLVGLVDKQLLARCDLDNKEGKPGTADAIKIGKRLLELKELEPRVVFGALRCYYLMGTGWLSVERGAFALTGFADDPGALSLDKFLENLQWAR